MIELFVAKTPTGLVAADGVAQDVIDRLADGEVVRAFLRKPRDGRAHRRYWALVGLVYQNTDQFPSPHVLHQYLKVRAGCATPVICRATGETYLLPDSISFDRMEQNEFDAFWRRVVDVVVAEILPTLDSAELETEVLRCAGLAN